jgi:hypothetical protein
MGILFPRQEPFPRNALNSFKGVLKNNGFVGEDFVIPNTPKDPHYRMSNHHDPFKRLLATFKGRQKKQQSENKWIPETP